MLRLWPVMNVEGSDAGGSGVAAPEAKVAESPALVPAAPAAAKKPTVLRMQARAQGADRASLKTLSGELDAVRKTSAETKAALDTTAQELLTERFEVAFEAARIDPAYRDYARTKLGAINPKSAEGKKAVDDFAKAHPGMVMRAAQPSNPKSTWLDSALDKDKDGKSLAARMGRDMLEQTIDKLVQ